jgi:NADH dehydrogenase
MAAVIKNGYQAEGNTMKRIIIIGCGFAGLWAAIGAARKRYELEKENELEIIVINKNEYHGIRVRYYENDLQPTQISLDKLLNPVGVKYKIGEVTDIDLAKQQVTVTTKSSNKEKISYDRLVLCSGSHLHSPPVPGLSEYGFNIDSYDAADKLNKHFHALAKKPAKGRYTAVIVGGGFTGVEIACELPERLKNIAEKSGNSDEVRVIIIDHNDIGSTLGANPQPILNKVLQNLQIETKTNTHVVSIQADSVTLESGEVIDTQTVIWTAGMRADHLTELFPVARDQLNRITVDANLRIPGVIHCFAAGDVACAMVDDIHTSVMSCQHARPQGRIVGHNVVADLYGEPMLDYRQEQYVTILDLGSWGALYMEGWDRKVVSEGAAAKKTKIDVNHQRIYPPLTENANDLFNAAVPVIQAVPTKYTE